MPDSPTTLAVTLVPMQEVLNEYGLDFRALARRAGVDPDLPTRPNARGSVHRLQKLWQLASRESGDPLFGLRVGQHARPAVFHALGLGVMSSDTLLAALRRVERYSRLLSTNGRLVVLEDDECIRLEGRPTEHSIAPSIATFDAFAVLLCRLLKLCAGAPGIPRRVLLPHAAPPDAAPFVECLGCPVGFDAPNLVFEFDARTARQPVASGNPALAAEADQMAERYLAQIAPESAAARVRALLMKAMPSGTIDQDGIARSLHQSTSTLQRRLRDEGTTYQQLLDQTRRDLALEYLRAGEHSLADITFLLG
ncbi:MAG TPA: AraC family transcriptional regulator ligand-binding domain-containing protein, partial [Steroidobacteraceae bacterium]